VNNYFHIFHISGNNQSINQSINLCSQLCNKKK